jgi:hypothetical protein
MQACVFLLTPAMVGPSSMAPMNTTCLTSLRLLKPVNLLKCSYNSSSKSNSNSAVLLVWRARIKHDMLRIVAPAEASEPAAASVQAGQAASVAAAAVQARTAASLWRRQPQQQLQQSIYYKYPEPPYI